MGKNKIDFQQQYDQLDKDIKFLARNFYLMSSRLASDGLREEQSSISISEYFILGIILIHNAQKKQINQEKIIEFTGLDQVVVAKAINALIEAKYIKQIIDKRDPNLKHLITNNKLQNHFILANKILLLLEYLFLDK